MPRYRLTQRARRDPLAVWNHIAEDSELHAVRFIDRLMKSIGPLGENPYIGRRREHDLRTGLYSFPVEKYVILYRIDGEDAVWILHVVHGSRDLPELLSHRKG